MKKLSKEEQQVLEHITNEVGKMLAVTMNELELENYIEAEMKTSTHKDNIITTKHLITIK